MAKRKWTAAEKQAFKDRMAKARAAKGKGGRRRKGGGGDPDTTGHRSARGGAGGRELHVDAAGNVFVPGTQNWEVSFGTTQTEEVNPVPLIQAAIAFLQEGFKGNKADFSSFVPPVLNEIYLNQAALQRSGGQQPAGISDKAWELYRDYGQERWFGKNLFQFFGVALMYLNVTAAQWASLYPVMMAKAREKVGGGGSVVGSGWSSPLGAPAQVTSQFGVRDGTFHKGVDLAAGVGTPVLAPVAMKIFDVDDDAESGNYVQGVAALPDGSFPIAIVGMPGTPFSNDSTWVQSFSHLGSTTVKEGDIVQQGQQIGTVGMTGRTTGPHLHWRVSWFDDDNTTNERIDVNPLSLVPAEIIAQGPGAMAPVADGKAQAIFSPMTGGAGALLGLGPASTGGQVVIANNSVIAIAGRDANSGVGVGNQVDLGLIPSSRGASGSF